MNIEQDIVRPVQAPGILHNALLKLRDSVDLIVSWHSLILDIPATSAFSDKIKLTIDGLYGTSCWVDIVSTLQTEQVGRLTARRRKVNNDTPSDAYLVVANYIPRPVAEQLRLQKVNYLDGAGNAYLNIQLVSTSNQAIHQIYIQIDGQKPERQTTERADHAFTKTGIRATFWYLTNPERAGETLRVVAKETQVSLETAQRVRNSLTLQGFLTEGGLTNRVRLLDKWMDAYAHRLKPSLLMGHFTLAKSQDIRTWTDWQLPPDTYWGGEPAADLLTRNLQPAHLTLYSRQAKIDLMRHFKLLPAASAAEATVSIYQPFWAADSGGRTVHPLLIYADLLGQGSARNADVAHQLYDQHLSYLAD